jgi:hypothetical protein
MTPLIAFRWSSWSFCWSHRWRCNQHLGAEVGGGARRRRKKRVERVEITVVSPDSLIADRAADARAQLTPASSRCCKRAHASVAVRRRPGVTHGTFGRA